MYYSAPVPANGNPVAAEKPNIYVPTPNPYGQAPTGFPHSSSLPPPCLPIHRYAAAPQAYAVVSTPNPGLTGYTMSPAFSSLAAYSQVAGISTSTAPASQYSAGVPFTQEPLAAPRSVPPSHYGGQPLQAGTPLIAGYSPVPSAMPTNHAFCHVPSAAARSFPVGTIAAYPPGYPTPAQGSAPIPYHGVATYSPPYQ